MERPDSYLACGGRIRQQWLYLTCFGFLLVLLGGCDPDEASQAPDDPNVVPFPDGLDENREFISPPVLGWPIYACAQNVTVTDFLQNATLQIFVDGSPAPNPTVVGTIPSLGVNHNVGVSFTAGQQVWVTQTKDGITSSSSNIVTVTSHLEDYPDGLPKPRLWKHPLHQCGKAVLVEDVVPGSRVEISTEDPASGGGFDPANVAGAFNASTEWGHNWSGVSPEFKLGTRVRARAQLCTSVSPNSDAELAEIPPNPVPGGAIEEPIVDGQTIFKIWGEGGAGDPPVHGPLLQAYETGVAAPIGKTVAPGGAPHLLGVPAVVAGNDYHATQTLCVESNPGPTTTAVPCEDLPAPEIAPPLPGDTQVHVTSHIPGADIIIFADGEEVGHSSGDTINLSRPLENGEIVVVVQRLGDCTSNWVYQIDVECALGETETACSGNWPAFRHNPLRNARQIHPGDLADPYKVKTLEEKQRITPANGGRFRASPVVHAGRVFIGTSEGTLYAYDANTLSELWRYPPAGESRLTSQWPSMGSCNNPSSEGIASSVAIGRIQRERDVVILAAPDQTGRNSLGETSFGSGFGSGRLFALDPENGNLIWASGEIARLDGAGSGDFHEQIGYSSPLVLDGRVYVGIANHCDNPIQNGRVKAVELDTGNIVPASTFEFVATGERGGGVWTYVSGGLGGGLFTTTGNTKNGTSSEPSPNHGLSMVRIDPASGALDGKIQPVPYELDGDPDWAAGATLMSTSCGDYSVSTMKDGWSYAGRVGPPLTFTWQFPNTAYPFPVGSTTDETLGNGDLADHGDIRYHRAGAGWGSTYITMSGGEDIVDRETVGETFAGYNKLHALNVCGGTGGRVRWIADLAPYTSPITSRHSWGVGPPTVADGIVYVGTNRGFLVAIADPSVWPDQGARCTWSALDGVGCLDMGFQMVPQPTILRAIDLGAGHTKRTEPVIANNSIYVATENGALIRLAPQ